MPNAQPDRLTRAQMVDIIERGESVMMPNGTICSRVEDLPAEAHIALMLGDEGRLHDAKGDLKAKIAQMTSQLQQIDEAERLEAERKADEQKKRAEKPEDAEESQAAQAHPVRRTR